jgi:hypothetical protein
MTIASDLLRRHIETLVADNTQWQTLIADDLVWELPYRAGRSCSFGSISIRRPRPRRWTRRFWVSTVNDQ